MDEMNELFYRDPYCRTFEAEVLDCRPAGDRWAVVLSDTAFYPEGGGQPADRGTLGPVHVLDVHRRDGQIVHTTDGPLPVGGTVRGDLDWMRRFDHMQNHSGEHIVSGLVYHRFGWDNVGFHLGDAVVIDFNGPLTWADALAIEREANAVIWANEKTLITCPTEAERAQMDYRSKKALTGKVRLVEFPGADRCACCGTHVARAGEIGLVKMLSLMRHRGGVRLTLLCGRRAMAYLGGMFEDHSAAARALSVQTGEVAAAVEREKGHIADLRQALSAARRDHFRLLAETLPAEGLAVFFAAGLSMRDLRDGAETLARTGRAAAYLLLSGTEGAYQYVLCSTACDVHPLGRAMNDRLRGRGGGKDAVQGTFAAAEGEIRRAAAELGPRYLVP